MKGLLQAFESPLIGWLTVAFFISACIETYIKRIEQYKRTGALPPEASSGPCWVALFFWTDIPLKIALVALNWRFGLLVYALGFVLAVLGVLEHIGSFLMYPFVRTALPNVRFSDAYSNSPMVQQIVLRCERRHFLLKMLITVAAYVGLSFLLNAIRGGEPAAVFLWSLSITHVVVYFYIFWLAAARAGECGFRVLGVVGILAIVGRINDFELIVLPAVVVASLVVSQIAQLPRLANEADQSPPEGA